MVQNTDFVEKRFLRATLHLISTCAVISEEASTHREIVGTVPHYRCKSATLVLGYADIYGVITMYQYLTNPVIIGSSFSITHIPIGEITQASHS